MSARKYFWVIGIVLISALVSCNAKKTQDQSVSPSLVTNPISASGTPSKTGLPVLEFAQSKHDFGLVMQGEKLSYTFKFTNTGGSDAVISQVSSTCGCTIVDWDKAPVKPGGKGEIEVVFNSAGKSGTVNKTVSVLANTQPNTIQLEITAEVYVPDSKK